LTSFQLTELGDEWKLRICGISPAVVRTEFFAKMGNKADYEAVLADRLRGVDVKDIANQVIKAVINLMTGLIGS